MRRANRVWTVAMRDFRHTVMTKAFIFGVVGVPILIVVIGAITIAMIVSHKEPPLIGTVALFAADEDVHAATRTEFALAAERGVGAENRDAERAQEIIGDLTDGGMATSSAVAGTLGQRGEVRIEVDSHFELDTEPSDTIRRALLDGDLLAVAWISDDVLVPRDPEQKGATPRFSLLVAEGVDSDHIGLIERSLGDAVVRVRTERAGQQIEATQAMVRRPRSATERLLANGETRAESAGLREIKSQMIPMVFMMLIFGASLGTASQLLTSTIEEKSNRVMEVLLSAVSPLQLMSGKILGQCFAGMIIVTVYSSLGVGGLLLARQADLVSTSDLIYLAVYFFMAFFMIASIMAAVGSAVSDLREANSLVIPVNLLIGVPVLLWLPISQSPNGAIATVFSFIPPAIPFVMILRIAAEEPVAAWQIALSIIWGYAATFGLVWMAARIFRVGVLMTGKPPSPLELLRWVRYS